MITFDYATDLFEEQTIRRWLGAYKALLERLPTELPKAVKDVEILSPADREMVLHTWNATSRRYPAGRTLVDLFVAQAKATPTAEAIVDGRNERPTPSSSSARGRSPSTSRCKAAALAAARARSSGSA